MGSGRGFVTITIDISPEAYVELARRAASHGSPIEAYAADLLEEAVQLPADDLANCHQPFDSSQRLYPVVVREGCRHEHYKHQHKTIRHECVIARRALRDGRTATRVRRSIQMLSPVQRGWTPSSSAWARAGIGTGLQS